VLPLVKQYGQHELVQSKRGGNREVAGAIRNQASPSQLLASSFYCYTRVSGPIRQLKNELALGLV
jgi:hypothetical protein